MTPEGTVPVVSPEPQPNKIVTAIRTLNVSQKAKLAAIIPTITAVLTVLIAAISVGHVDSVPLAAAVGQVVAAVLAFGGAYFGLPGDVEVDPAEVDKAPLA